MTIQKSPPKADQPPAEKSHILQKFIIIAILFLLPIYLIRIRFGWISFNLLELLIGILFLIWFFDRNKKYEIPNTRYKIPVILIIAGLFLSVIANNNYYIGFGAIKGWFIFPIIFGIIFYDQLRKNDGLLYKSLLTLFFSGAAVSAIGIIYKFLGIMTYDGRLKIFWDSPNQLAMFLAPAFLIGIKLSFGEFRELSSRREKAELWKVIAIILGSLLILFNLYLTKSIGAWMAVAVTLGATFWLKYGKNTQKKYSVIFVVFLLIFILWTGIAKYEQIKNLGDRSSLASRIMIWKSAGLMIKDNPYLGIGPGNFQSKYLEYQKYFPPYLEWSVPQPHNLFLAFWLESGLVGLIGFVTLLVYFFRDNKKAIRNDRSLGILCFGIMLYFLIHGLVDTIYWRNDMAAVFWIVIAGNYFISEESAEYRNGK